MIKNNVSMESTSGMAKMSETLQASKLIESCEGVFRLKTPLNIQKGSVNSYMLRGRDGGWVIIDPGYSTQPCRRGWLEAMETLGFGFNDIKLILITHFHGDHAGLAGWFEKQCSAPIYMHPYDIESYSAEWDDDLGHVNAMVGFMSQYGLHGSRIEELRRQMADIGTASIDVCSNFLNLSEGDEFPVEGGVLHTMFAPGHSSGHCMFWFPERKLLFSGDMLLPLTYAPVGLRSYGDDDPVESIISALDTMAEGPLTSPGAICLPGHGWALEEPAERAAAAADHFRETAQWYYERCRRQAASAYDIAEELASGGTKRKFHLLMSEAMAYLEYLRRHGRLERDAGKDGFIFYAAERK